MSIVSLARRALTAPVVATIRVLDIALLTYEAGEQAVQDVADAIEQARLAVVRVVALLDAAEVIAVDIATTATRAAAVATLANAVAMDSAAAVVRVEAQLCRTERILDAYVPVLMDLEPVLSQASKRLEPSHVEAVIRLLDLTPEVIDLIAPALHGMGNLTPELDQLAERFESIGQIVEGIPGAGILKRRGSEQHDTDNETGNETEGHQDTPDAAHSA